MKSSDMRKRVLKWSVPINDDTHMIGTGAVVHVGQQAGVDLSIQVWTEEPPETAPLVMRAVRVCGTGHSIPYTWQHLGSVIADLFVWHVYETFERVPR